MQTTLTLDQLGEEIVAILPRHTETEQRIGVTLQRHLAKGAPVAASTVASDVGLPAAEVDAALEQMPGVFRDDERRMIGYFGLTIREMGKHRIHLDGQTLSPWCAWDTLLIPHLIGPPDKLPST